MSTAGLGESELGGGKTKRRKRSKRPLDVLDDDQTLSRPSIQVQRRSSVLGTFLFGDLDNSMIAHYHYFSLVQSLGEVAVRCMCELLVGLPHFNFRNNILAAIVPRMVCKTLGGKVWYNNSEKLPDHMLHMLYVNAH